MKLDNQGFKTQLVRLKSVHARIYSNRLKFLKGRGIFAQAKVNLGVGKCSDSFFLLEIVSTSRHLSITHCTLGAAYAHK